MTVCGDVHGQFYDLLTIFEANGLPSQTNPYIFNGDFVDRGSFSFEVAITLLACKVQHPNCVHLNRGNHETRTMARFYGFDGEVRHKYDDDVLEMFHACFVRLPLCCVLHKRCLVVHGGLPSEDQSTLKDIRKIERRCEPPELGLFCDVLWSDPQPFPGRQPSRRGVGLSFGPDVTKRFLERSDLALVVRSHEVRDRGYEVEHGGLLITVFSGTKLLRRGGKSRGICPFVAGSGTPLCDVQRGAAPAHPADGLLDLRGAGLRLVPVNSRPSSETPAFLPRETRVRYLRAAA